jgi:hypothetical protein
MQGVQTTSVAMGLPLDFTPVYRLDFVELENDFDLTRCRICASKHAQG